MGLITTCCAATQELSGISWNPKVYYRIHKSPPLVLTTPYSLSKTHLNILQEVIEGQNCADGVLTDDADVVQMNRITSLLTGFRNVE
jgi:hypothetical protein